MGKLLLRNSESMFESNKISYLQMIQNIIERMSNIGLSIKGFCVAGIGTVMTISDFNIDIILLKNLLIVTILFLLLDCYYLNLERNYRTLYNLVRLSNDECFIDFDLSLKKVCKEKYCYIKCLISKSNLLFYGAIIIIIIINYINIS